MLNLFPTFKPALREKESGVDDRTKAWGAVAGRTIVRDADLTADENIVVCEMCDTCAAMCI